MRATIAELLPEVSFYPRVITVTSCVRQLPHTYFGRRSRGRFSRALSVVTVVHERGVPGPLFDRGEGLTRWSTSC